MSIVSTCPHCGTKHKLPDESKVGRKLRCRECEEPFTIKANKRPARSRGGSPPGGLPPRAGGSKKKAKKKAKSAGEERKQKPARKRTQSAGKSPALIGGICVLTLGLLLGATFLFSEDKPLEAPSSYKVFTHSVNSVFKCEYPEGWTVDSGGTQGKPVWAKFTPPDDDDIKIRVRSSMGASAIGDIAKNLGGGGLGGGQDLDEDLAPVAQVHDFMKKQFADEYSEYNEKKPQTIKTGFGDARVAEFTASGSFGSEIRGMRASMLGLNLQFTVICECPAEDWDVGKKIFDRVIQSMSRG